MDSLAKLYLQRSENELILSKTNFEISVNPETKKDLGIPEEKTFFNNVISEAYYAIFFAAKAYLISLGINTKPPEEHKKTYEEFKRIIETGKLSKELLDIYESESEKAEVLLEIFFREKRKRGMFTYNVKSEANIPAAEESIKNAKTFVSAIITILK